MRTIPLVLLFIAGPAKPLTAQIAYYTAKALSDSFVVQKNHSFEFKSDPASKTRICGLLRDFLPAHIRQDSRATAGMILDEYLNNPFLGTPTKNLSNAKTAGDHLPSALKSYSPASMTGIPVTNFADGLGKFLVKRFTEELTITFFEKFKSVMAESTEMQTLFPQTYKILLTINTDVYRFSLYLNTLHEAFIQDFSNLYLNLKDLSHLEKYRPYFREHPALFTSLEGTFYLIDQYAAGRHPGEVLAAYDTSLLNFKDLNVQQNIRSAILVVQAVSGSFRSISSKHFWVPADSLRMLLSDEVARDIYFGLVCQKYGGITFGTRFGTEKRLDTLLGNARSAAGVPLLKYKNYIELISSRTDEVSDYVTELKEKKKSEIDYNDYYKLYNSSLDLIGQAFELVQLPGLDSLLGAGLINKIRFTSSRVLFVAHSTADMYIDIRTKNYSSAILNTAGIIDTLLAGDYDKSYEDSLTTRMALLKRKINNQISDRENKTIAKIINDFSGPQDYTYQSLAQRLKNETISYSAVVYLDSLITTNRLLSEADRKRRITYNILKYGTFAATLAQAKGSDEVHDAIESVALPSGSSRIKREAYRNISLNGYLGGFAGWEYLPALKQNRTSPSIGLSAPVGLGYSFGRIGKGKNKIKGGESLTIFVPVIDVGALAAFRFANDSSKVASDVQFKNILAPGLFLYFGLRNCPISIGAGVQVGPQLRDIPVKDPANINIDKNFYVRYGLSVAVDIPFLNFFTKSEE